MKRAREHARTLKESAQQYVANLKQKAEHQLAAAQRCERVRVEKANFLIRQKRKELTEKEVLRTLPSADRGLMHSRTG